MSEDLASLIGPGRSAVVVAPHPDDETFGCGGVMALLAKAEKPVHPVFCSDGEAIERDPFEPPPDPDLDMGAARRRETRKAAEILGVRDPEHLAFPDGRMGDHLENLAASISAACSARSASLVLAPWPGEQHDDHVAVSWAAARAAFGAGLELVLYEVNTPLCPNLWVDIEPVMEQKRRAIMAYHYSLYGKPSVFWQAISGLNAYRAFYFIRTGWFEAFVHVREGRHREHMLRWIEHPPVPGAGCPF